MPPPPPKRNSTTTAATGDEAPPKRTCLTTAADTTLPGTATLPHYLHADYVNYNHGSKAFPRPPWIILIPYAGKDDNTSLATAIQQTAPWLSQHSVELDAARKTTRCSKKHLAVLS